MVKIIIKSKADGQMTGETRIRKVDEIDAMRELLAAVTEIRDAVMQIAPEEIRQDIIQLLAAAILGAELPDENPSHDEEAEEEEA